VGVDLSGLVDELVNAMNDGRLSEAAIDASLHRVLALRREASGISEPYVDCGLKCWGLSPRSVAATN
jgi:beta-N-acetylhexosaminidase